MRNTRTEASMNDRYVANALQCCYKGGMYVVTSNIHQQQATCTKLFMYVELILCYCSNYTELPRLNHMVKISV